MVITNNLKKTRAHVYTNLKKGEFRRREHIGGKLFEQYQVWTV